MNKKILFLTGTRADFGKLKSLIKEVENTNGFESHIFVTGMHMLSKYGMTANEVDKGRFKNIYKYINQNSGDSMDIVLAKTIHGLSDYVKELAPDMIVIHGDRVEALAGAIVGSLNNILVSHVEGGEVSGTIDELIRHSVTKMSHIHFVCNQDAKTRLEQLGERNDCIHIIGSPDLDIMSSDKLPPLNAVKERYDIPYDNYSVFMYHPVTTDVEGLKERIEAVVDALVDSEENYVVVYPNNDLGSDYIINELERLKDNHKFRVFPSIRFEYFLVLLENSKMIIGNSSAGVREAPFYGVPTINLGTRQNGRSNAPSIFNCNEKYFDVLHEIKSLEGKKFLKTREFGAGDSDRLFIERIKLESMWSTSKQKVFVDII